MRIGRDWTRVHATGLLLVLSTLWLIACSASPTLSPPSPPAGTASAPASTALPVPAATTTFPAATAPSKATGGENAAPAASGIQLPTGFRAFVYYQGLRNPTSLAFGPDGRLYIAEQSGRILSLGQQNGQGSDARANVQVAGVTLGIAFRPGTRDLYISSTGRVLLAHGADDGTFSEPKTIGINLPTGRHQNDEIAFTPDGKSFYLGVGSTCDACKETNPLSAAILRISADGTSQEVYAHGTRNPFGLAIHPQTGELFATDNGRDAPLTGVPDELNVIVANGHYGWPDCWGNGKGTNCQGTIPPVAEFQEHSSADGFAFYTGSSFPAEYRGDVFVAEWGGNLPVPTIGKRVERVVLKQANGKWQGETAVFATGFDHPIAVAVGPQDGALYIADYGSGTIYRIVFAGQ